MALLVIVSALISGHSLAKETNASAPAAIKPVSPADLNAFMEKWKPYEPFKYPDDPKEEPLLLAALQKDPGDPWVTYLNLKFSFDKLEARRLSLIERTQKFRDALNYLEAARNILLQAAKTRPDDKKLMNALQEIEQAIAQASLETGGDPVKIKGTTQALLEGNTQVNVWENARVVYDANVTLGRIAIREGKIDEAKKYLLAAAKTRGATQLNTFDPDFILARELLERGEKDVVLEFLDLVERFWAKVEAQRPGDAKRVADKKLKKLEAWREQVRNGKIPDDPEWK